MHEPGTGGAHVVGVGGVLRAGVCSGVLDVAAVLALGGCVEGEGHGVEHGVALLVGPVLGILDGEGHGGLLQIATVLFDVFDIVDIATFGIALAVAVHDVVAFWLQDVEDGLDKALTALVACSDFVVG